MNANQRVDYRNLAAGYDRRYRVNPMTGVERRLGALVAALEPKRVLEVGCGTGHWLSVLGAGGATVIGIDLSLAMLSRHGGSPTGITLVCGDGDRLGLRPAKFDLIVCVNALHNLIDPGRFIQHCAILLRTAGVLTIVTLDLRPEHLDRYIYDFFAGTREQDRIRHPDLADLRKWFLSAGFERLEVAPVERVEACLSGRAVLADYFLERDSNSTLALLDPDEYAHGLERLRAHVAAAEDSGRVAEYRTRMRLLMVMGRTAEGVGSSES